MSSIDSKTFALKTATGSNPAKIAPKPPSALSAALTSMSNNFPGYCYDMFMFFKTDIFRFTMLIIYYLIGGAFYYHYEGWTTVQCIYFITASISTVGYGQLHPTTDNSRVWTVFYIVPGVFLFVAAVKHFAGKHLYNLHSYIVDAISPQVVVSRTTKCERNCVLSVVMLIVIDIIGTIGYCVSENWSIATGWYWATMTLFTVGYGDLTIHNDSTRSFGIFFLYFTCFFYVVGIRNFFEMYQERAARAGDSKGVSDTEVLMSVL